MSEQVPHNCLSCARKRGVDCGSKRNFGLGFCREWQPALRNPISTEKEKA